MADVSTVKRYRSFNWTQQLEYLPFDDFDALKNRLDSLGAVEWAYIIHDEDTDKDGQLKAKHIHCVMSFKNAHTIQSIANKLTEKNQYIEPAKNYNNSLSYLVHATDNAQDKFQYNSKLVETSGFNFAKRLDKIAKDVRSKKQLSELEEMLDRLASDADYTYLDAMRDASPTTWALHAKKFKTVWVRKLKITADEWLKERTRSGIGIKVIWIYGAAGTGKTSMARELLESEFNSNNIFITGSNRDPFQEYAGQHSIIWNDLRHENVPYNELLNILDPFSSPIAGSRYNDKILMADKIIITTPYAPYNFWNLSVLPANQKIDTFKQLKRRLSNIIYMDDKYVHDLTYGPETQFSNINIWSTYGRNNHKSKDLSNNSSDIMKQISNLNKEAF